MAIERILGTDTGKAAFEKADRNFVGHEGQIDSLIVKGYANTISITDFNNATENGKYTGYSILNAPTTNSTVNVEVIKEASGVVSQIAVVVFGTGAGNAYTRIKQINGVWAAWEKIATDKHPDWITQTLLNGWAVNTPIGYRKNQIGNIDFKGTIHSGTIHSGTIHSGTILFTLPVGYRPSVNKVLVVSTYTGTESKACPIIFGANGNVEIFSISTFMFISLDGLQLLL